jgi:murein DD-endopeptidase MepM/ murein hydrolase activator NlpD
MQLKSFNKHLKYIIFSLLLSASSWQHLHANADSMQVEIDTSTFYPLSQFSIIETIDTIKTSVLITEVEEENLFNFRFGPVDDFFIDWDTAVVNPYEFDVKEITYEFPLCLFISPDVNYALPLKSLYKTSPFGPRWGRHHKGIDFNLNTGDSVFNMFDGMVRISTYSSSFGNYVVIRHFNGLETIYAHLSERSVSPGDILKAGDCLGLGGSTGRSTGPHLHFEVRFKGIAFDPENLLSVSCQDIASEELTIAPTLFSYINYKKGRNTSGKANYHTIRNGENLGSIARKYNTSVSQLCRLNGIKPNSIIHAGKSLRVR